jgi:hypothetical protein
MRTIIAGSRGCTDRNELISALEICGWVPTTVISGTANGPDQLGEMWAKEFNIPCERYPADWKTLGKSAGYIRNEQMAQNAESLIALWDGVSKGTKNMIDIARRKGLKVYVHLIK